MKGTDILELVLLMTGLLTSTMATASLFQSWLDRQALLHAGRNGVRKLVATQRIFRDIARLVASLVLSVAAWWCLMLPQDTHVVSLLLKHALMFMGWLLMASVLADWQSRRHLEDMLERIERGERV